jgi:hypothetical protein
MRARVAFAAWAVAPLLATVLAFVAVLRSGPAPAPLARSSIPLEPYAADHCTWYCHNRGCPHRPALGAFLAGDGGLFGWTIGALHRAGDSISPGSRGAGYGIANLAVFCAIWPAGMYALWIVALRQRRAIRALRSPRGGAP